MDKDVKTREVVIDMRNLSKQEVAHLTQLFSECKTLDEQKKLAKQYDLEIEFKDVPENSKEGEVVDESKPNSK